MIPHGALAYEEFARDGWHPFAPDESAEDLPLAAAQFAQLWMFTRRGHRIEFVEDTCCSYLCADVAESQLELRDPVSCGPSRALRESEERECHTIGIVWGEGCNQHAHVRPPSVAMPESNVAVRARDGVVRGLVVEKV